MPGEVDSFKSGVAKSEIYSVFHRDRRAFLSVTRSRIVSEPTVDAWSWYFENQRLAVILAVQMESVVQLAALARNATPYGTGKGRERSSLSYR